MKTKEEAWGLKPENCKEYQRTVFVLGALDLFLARCEGADRGRPTRGRKVEVGIKTIEGELVPVVNKRFSTEGD